ncbi:hypothetical protein [Streptomyces sp. NPDC094032]|uniref:hypothetical protein n=1 Tax=Streptomyces sp. NPDC094032 TaxID=3155308 RepID=UPI0033277443
MPTTSPIPIPVLHSGKDTVVRPEGDALLIRRPHEETHIPLKAISRVLVEGRTVTIKLTSGPETATTYVHHVQDVDEAAGLAFAEAVNRVLPERTEAVDGAGLVTGERLYQPSYRNWIRRVKRGSLFALLAAAALCVLVGVTGHPAALVAIIPFSVTAIPFAAFGTVLLFEPYEEWYLRRHGVRTSAIRLRDQRATYAYTDPGGLIRTVRGSSETWNIMAVYDPRDPGRVVPLRTRSQRILSSGMALLVLGIGLLFAAGVVVSVVGAFLGVFEGPAWN